MYTSSIEQVIERGAAASTGDIITRLLLSVLMASVLVPLSRDEGTWALPTARDLKVIEGTISHTRARTSRSTSLLIRLAAGSDFEFGCVPNNRKPSCPDFGYDKLRGRPAKLTYFDVPNIRASGPHNIAVELRVDGKPVLGRSERLADLNFVLGRQRANDNRWPLFATIGWLCAAVLMLPVIIGKFRNLFKINSEDK